LRGSIGRFAGAVALAAVFAGAEGDCSTSTKDAPEADSEGEGKNPRAKLGDTITLKGTNVEMKVKPTKVYKQLSVGEFDEPQDSGNRFVGVEVQLTNVGQETYDDSPSNGAVVITSGDEQGASTIVSGGPCAGQFASSAKISPGSKRKGCIPFEVPKGKKVKTFQFSLDSGFGPESGEWSVR